MSKFLHTGFTLFATLGAGIAAAAPVDINCADASALAAGLNGIGDAKAEAIVAYRTENGPFKTADDLATVKGIGAKTVEANRANITLGESCPPPTAAPQQ
jgi:competence protein ComEA